MTAVSFKIEQWFNQVCKEDDALDAELTDLGRNQAKEARDRIDSSKSNIQLVVASPLSRALATAQLIFPAETRPGSNFVCLETLRERNGWLLNAQRKQRSTLQTLFPACDFSLLPSEMDESWTDELESPGSCAERAYQSLLWLSTRKESEIALVAHGGLFHEMLNGHPLVHTEADIAKRFTNCEIRTCSMQVSMNENCDSSVGDDANARPNIKLLPFIK